MENTKTTNGVEIVFNNNSIFPREGDVFFKFDNLGNLTNVNFDGYIIKAMEKK